MLWLVLLVKNIENIVRLLMSYFQRIFHPSFIKALACTVIDKQVFNTNFYTFFTTTMY
jgi:hypothetical protein